MPVGVYPEACKQKGFFRAATRNQEDDEERAFGSCGSLVPQGAGEMGVLTTESSLAKKEKIPP
jgi:hypothetical protein